MKTRQVERQTWERYFDSLSNVLHHRPRKVVLEEESESMGAQVLAEHARLTGIMWDPKGSEAGSLDIETGNDVTGERDVHRINQVCVVWVEEDDAGNPVALDIEGQDPDTREAVKAIVRFEE